MKNFVQDGDTITIAAPYALTSGNGCQKGMLFGVATADALNGAQTEIQCKGVFNVNKLSTDVIAEGDPLYWDNTNKRLTSTATANLFVGHATDAAGNGVATVNIRLCNASKAVG